MWRGCERDTQPESRAPAMPLTQEKRLETSFTNNNDHNYLHKKFKKLASTLPRNDGHSSESDSSQYNNTTTSHTTIYSINNRSIAAAHPEIEKIKDNEIRTAVERQIGNIVQNILRNQPSEVHGLDGEITETEEKDAGTGRYTCMYCRASFFKPSVLRKHIRAHTNERSHPCDPCGIAFKAKANLHKHCRSQSHASRSRGENVPRLGPEEFSGESESDTSQPPSDAVEARLSLDGERSDLPGDRRSPAVYESVEDTKARSIYKPKFHRASSYREDEKHKKVLSPNPSFLNEHISKIISDNEAIVDVLETPLQKKYARIKQIAETRQLYDDNLDAKSDHAPLNLSKKSDESVRRKRSHSDSFAQTDKHPLNPEGSIIKDLLLKTKMCTAGLLPVTQVERVYHPVETSSVDEMELQIPQYGRFSNGVSEPSLSPREVVRNFESEHIFMRSNSINVTLPESRSSRYRNMLRSPSNNIPYKPDNIVIIKPEGNDIVAPLPSPGPLLGNTRLVDSRVDNARSKSFSNTAKRRLDTRSEAFNTRLPEDMFSPRLDTYPHKKSRPDFQPTMRQLEELSQSPLRKSSSLQMFGGEVKIINNSGSTTTLRIEPTRQLSPIVVPRLGSPKHGEGEASNIVRSGLHSGGTIMHNPPTPKEITSSPHSQTQRIMLSIAANVPTPNLTVTSLQTQEITHFQFPPLDRITAFNPLTLPPRSPSLSPKGPTTILHGGKIIPHVPGMPGPNTTISFTPQLKYQQNGEYALMVSSKDNLRAKIKVQNYDFKPLTGVNQSLLPEKSLAAPIPRLKVRTSQTSNQVKYNEKSKEAKNFTSEAPRANVSLKPIETISLAQPLVTTKINEANEERNFNFENLITKAEIYTSGVPTKQQKSIQDPLTISVRTQERSETAYFQKNTKKEESKSKFLRPTNLPLKPGTFTPKKHHGITPNANTMPLISPETPRPAKAYGQLYLNGNAYTYLGLKCSTKVFYCTLNRPQPTYVPNQVSLSMYCNWQILMEQAPHPLGLSPLELMCLYDSRHRPAGVSVARISTHQILTHSSQWNTTHADADAKQKPAAEEKKYSATSKSASSTSSGGSKELAGGFESNEEYTYVRGRGRGRYVCGECGIRCKKPSMLKKHVRTHTNVRPYTCQHCAFSFKTKGNLTKHMKSKAHYKKCSELGISTDGEGGAEGGDSPDHNEPSGDSDTDSDPDEGETESSDTDSWKSRLPEHEAAHCLLSLSRPAQAPGLVSAARPNTYPYTPLDDAPQPDHPEPIDLSRSETRPEAPLLAARESSVLASLASNTAALLPAASHHPHEPMLHAYLTERALLDTRIKQSQCVTTQAELHSPQSDYTSATVHARVERFEGVVTYSKPPTGGTRLSTSLEPRTSPMPLSPRILSTPLTTLAQRDSLMPPSMSLAPRASPMTTMSLAPRSSPMAKLSVTPNSTSLAPRSSPTTSIAVSSRVLMTPPSKSLAPRRSPMPSASPASPTPRPLAPTSSLVARTSTMPQISPALRVSATFSTATELKVSAPATVSPSSRLSEAPSASPASRPTEPSPPVALSPLLHHEQVAEVSLARQHTQSAASSQVRQNAQSTANARVRLQVQQVECSLRLHAQPTEPPQAQSETSHASAAPSAADQTSVNTSTENAKFVASEYLKMAQKDDAPNDKTDDGDRDRFKVKKGGTMVMRAGEMTDYPPYVPARVAADGRAVCTVCDKSFSKSSQLRLHINIHYMERPFRCSACAVSFRTRGHLQKHERSSSHRNKASMTSTFGAATSANPRPFRCSDCNIAFRIHGHLAKHLRSKMHVMRLECLSKLPFGTFAEMERAGVSLTDIDTSDCENSLASLQLLAQRLHERDPSKLEAWAPTMLPAVLPPGDTSDDEQPAPDTPATDT